MLQRPFREHHLLALLNDYEEQQLPLDLVMSHYFRAHTALGSKDRAQIAEQAYTIIRWQGLLDYLSNQSSWESRLGTLNQTNLQEYRARSDIPLHIRCSFPKGLFDTIVDSHGMERAVELCFTSNTPAPTTVRVNTLKADRETLLERWGDTYSISPCKQAVNGIVFHKKINFFTLPEFKEGLFEVQDEGSQLLANLVQVEPGQQVLDYCSGSGGKTLAFAPQMGGKGQIYLHDIRKRILDEGKKRLKRAGVQNAQIILADDPKLKKLKKKMDWVLVDAPCSGTGTLRRNPDMKWKFSEEMLNRLRSEQRVIFEKGLSYLKPGGKIVYATCSLLKEENEEQIAHFQKTYPLKLIENPFQSLPSEGGMDGFYGAVFIQEERA